MFCRFQERINTNLATNGKQLSITCEDVQINENDISELLTDKTQPDNDVIVPGTSGVPLSMPLQTGNLHNDNIESESDSRVRKCTNLRN